MEIWKDIKGYENRYQVSNKGRVKSLDRAAGLNRKIKGKILNQCNTYGYLNVTLCKNGTKKTARVHRIVLSQFIENTNNYKAINHKDGVKTNNNINNLEWCSSKQNHEHAIKLGLKTPKIQMKNMKIRCIEYDKIFISQRECQRWLIEKGYKNTLQSSISKVISKKQTHHLGLHFERIMEETI